MPLRNIALVLLLVIMGLTGCAGTKQTVAKADLDTELAIPSAFEMSGGGESYSGEWWLIFEDTELNALMEQMLTNNHDIAGSYEGLRALQAALGISSADRLPSIDAGASAGEKYSTDTRGDRSWNDSYEISLTASYEADIWGRVKAGSDADRMALLAGRYDVETLYMTMSAELADRYFIYKSLTSALKMQQEMLELRQKQYSALEMMYSSGVGSLDTMYTKQSSIADLMETMTETMQSMQSARSQMAVLLGLSDPKKVSISDEYNLKVPYLPSVIPSIVASQRPDIRSAYASVLEIDRNVAAAMASRYPKLSFSASAAYSGDQLSSLISPENFVANLIANLTAPIFDAGKLKRQQEQQEYLLKKEIYAYYQTVLEGLAEVSDSLADNVQNEKALKLSQQRVLIEEKRLKVAEMKYEMGIGDYTDVIDDKLSLLAEWVTELNARRDLISSRIELARASGGSWVGELVDARLSNLPSFSGENK